MQDVPGQPSGPAPLPQPDGSAVGQAFEASRKIELDRALAVIFVAWAPTWLLLLALTVPPQGQDLLTTLNSDSYAAVRYTLTIIVLFGVATTCATILISLQLHRALKYQWIWYIPAKRPGKLRPLTTTEQTDAFRSTWWPVFIAVLLPCALLSSASFASLNFGLKTTFITLGFALFFAKSQYLLIRIVLKVFHYIYPRINVCWIVCLLMLIIIGGCPAQMVDCFTIEVLSVGIAIIWTLLLFGIALSLPPTPDDLPDRWPEILKRHFNWVAALAVFLFVHIVKTIGLPAGPTWMLPSRATSADTKIAQRVSMKDALDKFKMAHAKEKHPTIVLVTAAGGGIRAAYWSARVLASLQDGRSDFASHVFAISAVSGGALGAAAFKALTTMETTNCPDRQTYTVCAARFLSGDFIGPNIAAISTGGAISLLTSGIVNNLIVGRDEALEQAWAGEWKRHVPKGISLLDPFDDLFSDKRVLPALFLNGTSTFSGNRVITSNLDVATLYPDVRDVAQGKEDNRTAYASEGCIADAGIVNPAKYLNLSIAAAVLTSARFPYITPPGLLKLPSSDTKSKDTKTPSDANKSSDTKPTCREWEEIVDGGFVDNEGIVTATDIIDALINLSGGAEGFKQQFHLVVLRLAAERSPAAASHEKYSPPPHDQMDQIFATTMNQRAAAGQHLVNELQIRVGKVGGMVFEFNAIDDDAPLGWTLSPLSKKKLNMWFDGPSSSQWAEMEPSPDLSIIQEFGRKVDMPSRVQKVLLELGQPQ